MPFLSEIRLVQGPPDIMAQQLNTLENSGWEVREILDRPMFGNRLTVRVQRWVAPPPEPPAPAPVNLPGLRDDGIA